MLPIRKTRETINPYLSAGGLLWNRLRWDMDWRSWSSRARLRKLHGAYQGKKAVILCNGPSLLKTDWALLDGVFTFGLNKINLLFDSGSFRPSCIVAVNPLVLEQNSRFFNETQIPLFLEQRALRVGIRYRKGTTLLHATSVTKFARDCSVSLYSGGTVTYVALQLAFHMGFSSVALVGCDHSFNTTGIPNEVERADGPDANHFHPDYFSGGLPWQLPDLATSEASYHLARRYFEAFGREVVNATEGGMLEVFPRKALADFIASPG